MDYLNGLNQILMKRFSLLFAALFTAILILSCERPDPVIPEETDKPETEQPGDKPEEKPEDEEKPASDIPVAEKVNTYVINGTEYSFQSTAIMNVSDNLSIAASPEAGHVDVISIMTNASEYFFAGLSPTLIGKEIDLKTETALYTIFSTLKGSVIESLTPETPEEIAKGKCVAEINEGVMTLKAGMELTDGTTLAVNIKAEQASDAPVEVNDNEIGRGEEIKPLRAAFYLEEEGLTYLFFTPANISYFEELEIATWYMYLTLPTSLLNGEEIELDSITPDQAFAFGLVDNLTGDMIQVTNKNLSETEGIFCIENPEPGIYAVSFEFIVNGEMYYVWFDGKCISADIEMPAEDSDNYFAAGEEYLGIESAELEKSTEIWSLNLNLANGKTATMTMSAGLFKEGGVFGFSQDKNMAVSYNGITYSKANGNSGTITVYLDEEVGIIEAEFTNYDDCEFYYCGEYNIK